MALEESGLDTTSEGFVRVAPTLQTLSHPGIFAAGDVAAVQNRALPKSGVFAVRMAKPLERNLRAYLAGTLLSVYQPQTLQPQPYWHRGWARHRILWPLGRALWGRALCSFLAVERLDRSPLHETIHKSDALAFTGMPV
jgi:hypothetical protein